MTIASCQDLHSDADQKSPIKLTSKQKVEDIHFLYDFIRKSYPFAEAVEKEKGLPSIYDYEDDYSRKAGNTISNKEFILLVAEIIQRMEQGTGHSDIMEGRDLPPDFDTTKACLYSNITKTSIALSKYWWNLLNLRSKYTNSDLDVHYTNGDYVIAGDCIIDGKSIQKGTRIVQIDGQRSDDYVKSLQNKLWLRFDPQLKKTYSFHPSPFTVYGNESEEKWDVGFQDSTGHSFHCFVPKKQGYRSIKVSPVAKKNILLQELNDRIAYLRVSGFPDYATAHNDLDEMKSFFSAANGKYKKLIIDLRMNLGGSQAYGEELLVKSFLKEPTLYFQYAAVKKDVYTTVSKTLRMVDSLEKGSMRQYDFGRIEKIEFNALPKNIRSMNEKDTLYYYFKTTKEYRPNSTLRFNGEIVLLVDNDCFSAAEDIIRVFKALKIGKIAGANTLGGAGVVLPPLIFELPNSHILFTLEVELAYNSDGTINEIYGTKPDVELEPSTYPTSFPVSFSREDLLRDNWISMNINN